MSHVGKTYLSIHKSNEVVRDVSLDVEENEFVVLFWTRSVRQDDHDQPDRRSAASHNRREST